VPTVENNGAVVRGSGISATRLVRTQPAIGIEEFYGELRNLIKLVKVDQNTYDELHVAISKYAFVQKFFTKFEQVYDKLALFSKNSLEEGLHNVKDLIWLLFILAREESEEVITCVYNLIGAFHITLLYLPEDITYPALEQFKAQNPECTPEDVDSFIFQTLCAILNAGEPDIARSQADSVRQILEDFKIQRTIRCFPDATEFEGMLEARFMIFNLSKLREKYHHRLEPGEFDERHFLTRDTKIEAETPFKLTPFLRQGPINRSKSQLASQRVLNYDNCTKISMGTKLKDITLNPKNMPQSPYSLKTMPHATPITRAMEMNNWLERFVGQELNLTYYLESCKDNPSQSIHRVAEEIASKVVSTTRAHKLVKFFLRILNETLKHWEKTRGSADMGDILHNEKFIRSLMACCVEIFVFIHNISSFKFKKVLATCHITPFDFWKNINTMLEVPVDLPIQLKHHFGELDIRIVTQLAWEAGAGVDDILQSHHQGDSLETRAHNTFFKRVMQSAAFVVYNLCEQLRLGEESAEEVWRVLQHTLSEHPSLMVNRHIDQLVLSTIYAVFRAKYGECNIPFQKIIGKYQELYKSNSLLIQMTKAELWEIFKKVHIEGDRYADLIQFYNTKFAGVVKKYIRPEDRAKSVAKAATGNSSKIGALNPQSPLKDSLPPQIYTSGVVLKSPFSSPISMNLAKGGRNIITSPFNASTSAKGAMTRKPISFDNDDGVTTKKAHSSLMDKILNTSGDGPRPGQKMHLDRPGSSLGSTLTLQIPNFSPKLANKNLTTVASSDSKTNEE